jgi:hypothetical protein
MNTMNARMLSRGGLLLLAVTMAAVTPARAQVGNLDWTLHGGALLPISTFGEYFGTVGATAGVGVAYPLRDRLDLTLDLALDMVTRHNYYPTPSMKIWRSMVGVDVDLLGDQGDDLLLMRASAGAGLANLRTPQFWVESRPTVEGERISKTSLGGTGGLEVGLRTGSGLVWWLGAKLNWVPIDDGSSTTLRASARNLFDAPGAATSVALTLGFNLNR